MNSPVVLLVKSRTVPFECASFKVVLASAPVRLGLIVPRVSLATAKCPLATVTVEGR